MHRFHRCFVALVLIALMLYMGIITPVTSTTTSAASTPQPVARSVAVTNLTIVDNSTNVTCSAVTGGYQCVGRFTGGKEGYNFLAVFTGPIRILTPLHKVPVETTNFPAEPLCTINSDSANNRVETICLQGGVASVTTDSLSEYMPNGSTLGPPAPVFTGNNPTPTPTMTQTPAGGANGYISVMQPKTVLLTNPLRIVDTRCDTGGPIGYDPNGPIPCGPIQPVIGRAFRIAGKVFSFTQVGYTNSSFQVPPNITGVKLNVTTVQNTGSGGYVQVSAENYGTSNGSTLNPITAIAFNYTEVALHPGGGIWVYSTNKLDVVIDMVGYYLPE